MLYYLACTWVTVLEWGNSILTYDEKGACVRKGWEPLVHSWHAAQWSWWQHHKDYYYYYNIQQPTLFASSCNYTTKLDGNAERNCGHHCHQAGSQPGCHCNFFLDSYHVYNIHRRRLDHREIGPAFFWWTNTQKMSSRSSVVSQHTSCVSLVKIGSEVSTKSVVKDTFAFQKATPYSSSQ